jgi:RND family efflux transporter MFP subunit
MAEEVAAAEVEVARAQLALDRTHITSPIDGIILRLLAVPGQKRMLDMDDADSATIAVLFVPGALQVRVDVPLAEAAGLAVGQPATIRCDLLPDETFHGNVTRLAGEADLQRNTLQAKVNIVSPDPRLRPEMLCRVKFFAPRSSGPAEAGARNGRLALYIPEDAVRRAPRGAGTFVWVATPEGRAEKRPVTLGGQTREDHVSVTEGVRPGERVITGQPGDLEPGQRVRARP